MGFEPRPGHDRSFSFLRNLPFPRPGLLNERARERSEEGREDSIERVCEHRDGVYFVRLWLMQRHDFHPYNWMEFLKRLMRGNGIQVSREIYLIPTYTTFPRASDNYSRRQNFYEGWMRSNVCKSFCRFRSNRINIPIILISSNFSYYLSSILSNIHFASNI